MLCDIHTVHEFLFVNIEWKQQLFIPLWELWQICMQQCSSLLIRSNYIPQFCVICKHLGVSLYCHWHVINLYRGNPKFIWCELCKFWWISGRIKIWIQCTVTDVIMWPHHYCGELLFCLDGANRANPVTVFDCVDCQVPFILGGQSQSDGTTGQSNNQYCTVLSSYLQNLGSSVVNANLTSSSVQLNDVGIPQETAISQGRKNSSQVPVLHMVRFRAL